MDDDKRIYRYTGYGVDVSFPMHGPIPPNLPGAQRYDDFLAGCAAKFGMRATEDVRIEMNRLQPARQRNFTENGFTKLRAPESVYGPARAFWDAYKDEPKQAESWPAGNTYVNHWVVPTQMLSLEDRRFQPLGMRAKQQIWDGAQPILEAWTGQKLKPTSLYGIRVYGQGAILASHVDRLPLVTSAIIQVAQDVDEPWPVEVVGHDGKAFNVTLEEGDMALYESHTVLHGRPNPLKGRAFANIFVHFIPVDPQDEEANHPDVDFDWQKTAANEAKSRAFKAANEAKRHAFPLPVPAAESTRDAMHAAESHDLARGGRGKPQVLPPNDIDTPSSRRASRRASRADSQGEVGHQMHGGEDFGEDSFTTGSSQSLHEAAAAGDLVGVLRQMRDHDVNDPDENLWTPLHEAARSGSDAVAKALVEHGANLGARTVGGGSALWIAKKYGNAAVASYLEALGALELADEELR
ncbi:hypothetical protein M885DRAFT_566188 [Pelagophyceae sp. CCMP2097]|nr:hypothetical protein M885DRAFT_566188 [Pelagophyceae sp. CCMP2097]